MVFLGPPGDREDPPVDALGVQATRRGYRVAFETAHQWVGRLGAAKRAGRLDEELERLGRTPLLIVGEVGYIPFDPRGRGAVLRTGSLPLRTLVPHREFQQTFSVWAEIFGDPVAVAA